eukprot:CAMPEP_0171043558 /NCGR_PEP_ID=MMETSP0736-20130129/47102_1 /TAXON_ID=186038 /ORGANISM="Fragilariopsis kerguelensis, Strain L26-C5" /LENGTH=44 /DNA_ID= /DNA_START= /DNA_END= /DNA_ORIENTATION=
MMEEIAVLPLVPIQAVGLEASQVSLVMKVILVMVFLIVKIRQWY